MPWSYSGRQRRLRKNIYLQENKIQNKQHFKKILTWHTNPYSVEYQPGYLALSSPFPPLELYTLLPSHSHDAQLIPAPFFKLCTLPGMPCLLLCLVFKTQSSYILNFSSIAHLCLLPQGFYTVISLRGINFDTHT